MLGAGGSVNFFRFFRLPRVAFKCALSRCRASSTYLHCQSILRRKQQPGTRTFGAQADIAAGSRLSRLIQVTKSLQTRDWASDVLAKHQNRSPTLSLTRPRNREAQDPTEKQSLSATWTNFTGASYPFHQSFSHNLFWVLWPPERSNQRLLDLR